MHRKLSSVPDVFLGVACGHLMPHQWVKLGLLKILKPLLIHQSQVVLKIFKMNNIVLSVFCKIKYFFMFCKPPWMVKEFYRSKFGHGWLVSLIFSCPLLILWQCFGILSCISFFLVSYRVSEFFACLFTFATIWKARKKSIF